MVVVLSRHRQLWRRIGLVLAVVMAAAVVFVPVWVVPESLYRQLPEKDRVTGQTVTRSAVITGLLGLAAIIGAVLTGRTYQLSRQGQIIDRHTKAIRDHPTIVEVLSAFIREHASRPRPWPLTRVQQRASCSCCVNFVGRGSRQLAHQPQLVRLSSNHAQTSKPRCPSWAASPPGETSPEPTSARPSSKAPTSAGAHLERADLSGANLRGANLRGAHLERADLFGAHLDGAAVIKAELKRARPDRGSRRRP